MEKVLIPVYWKRVIPSKKGKGIISLRLNPGLLEKGNSSESSKKSAKDFRS